jgi:hypothetical protein
MQQYVNSGAAVRHYGEEGIYFTIFDRKVCISAISAEITGFSLNEPIAALWTDDATYARYLISTFETLWKQAIPAEERIKELRKQAPPHM